MKTVIDRSNPAYTKVAAYLTTRDFLPSMTFSGAVVTLGYLTGINETKRSLIGIGVMSAFMLNYFYARDRLVDKVLSNDDEVARFNKK